MKLTQDARIITAHGQDLGNLNRFVVDPETRHVTHIVFERGMLSPKELVLPIGMIDHTEDDKVFLKDVDFKLEDIPSFQEEHYILTNEHILPDSAVVEEDPGIRGYYYYPPVGFAPLGAPGLFPGYPASTYNPPAYGPSTINPIPVSGADEKAVRREVEENIPDQSVALKEGAKVLSSDAKHVGDVEKLFLDSENKVTHLLISKGMLFKEHKVVPMNWVKNIYEGEVFLSMTGDYLNKLPDYKEKTA